MTIYILYFSAKICTRQLLTAYDSMDRGIALRYIHVVAFDSQIAPLSRKRSNNCIYFPLVSTVSANSCARYSKHYNNFHSFDTLAPGAFGLLVDNEVDRVKILSAGVVRVQALRYGLLAPMMMMEWMVVPGNSLRKATIVNYRVPRIVTSTSHVLADCCKHVTSRGHRMMSDTSPSNTCQLLLLIYCSLWTPLRRCHLHIRLRLGSTKAILSHTCF